MTAPPSKVSTISQLSWQQAGRLKREIDQQKKPANISLSVPVPSDVCVAEIWHRLRQFIQQQDALRITRIVPEQGGWATYDSTIDEPMQYRICGSAEEMRAITSAKASRPFSRTGGPLWDVTLFEYRENTDRCRKTKTLFATFDHLISDVWSTYLFRRALTTGALATPGQGGDNYRDWVKLQNREFPRGNGHRPGPAREFWLRHLDGTAPDRAAPLPFCRNPHGRLSGRVDVSTSLLSVSPDELRAAAMRRQAAPFLLIVASVAASVATVSATRDVTLRIVISGRRRRFARTFGWFADCIPVRLFSPSLDSSIIALETTKRAWHEVENFQWTPWDYIMQECGLSPASPDVRQPQVVVNYLPYEVDGVASGDVVIEPAPGDVAGLQLIVGARARGKYGVACLFDPNRFVKEEVPEFLRIFALKVAELTHGQ